MNSPYPIEKLTDELERQLDAERIEHDAITAINDLLEMGEFARVEDIFREFEEKLPRKDAA